MFKSYGLSLNTKTADRNRKRQVNLIGKKKIRVSYL